MLAALPLPNRGINTNSPSGSSEINVTFAEESDVLTITLNGKSLELIPVPSPAGLSEQSKDRVSDEPLNQVAHEDRFFYVASAADRKHVQKSLCPEYRFDKLFFVKKFADERSAALEYSFLQTLSETHLFHRFPTVFSMPYKIDDGYLVFLELIEAPTIQTHFEEMMQAHLSPDVILLQYCDAFLQVLNTLLFLHEMGIYHCDIKSDNILFQNNLLKIIDFNGARWKVNRAAEFGTARYLPGYALKTRLCAPHETRSKLPLDVADFHLTLITFLEVMTKVFASHIDIPTLITSGIATKDRIACEAKNSDGTDRPVRYERYIAADADICKGLHEWTQANPDNKLIRIFSELLTPVSKFLRSSREDSIARIHSSNTLHDLHEDATRLLHAATGAPRNQPLRSLAADSLRKHMEHLLTANTGSVFSSFYPLVYLLYSDAHGWYDQPSAHAAATVHNVLRETTKGKMQCLDVGSAFGTAAFHAAEAGFERVYCWDNNPVFARLADLLWSEDQSDSWIRAVDRLLNDHIVHIASTCLNQSKAETRDQLLSLLTRKREQFSRQCNSIGDFVVADYWRLYEGTGKLIRSTSDLSFQYIICNNFLHWPVMDLEKLKTCVPDRFADFDLAGKDFGELISPLMHVLAKPGVLALIFPSQFLQVDGDDEFHRQAFICDERYRRVMDEARTTLLNKHFGVNLGLSPERRIRFRYSAIEEIMKQQYPQCVLSHEQLVYESDIDVRLLAMGAFPMIIAGIPGADMRYREEGDMLYREEADTVQRFFRDFAEMVSEKKNAISTGEPLFRECFHVVYIRR